MAARYGFRVPDCGLQSPASGSRVPPDSVPPSAFRLLPPPRRGFTLLELLMVMTIMIFITTIALMNILGGTRSSSYAAGANDVFDDLMLGRQRACLDGTKTFLLLRDSTNFVLVRDMGTVCAVQNGTNGPNSQLVDQYSDYTALLTTSLAGYRLVDMDRDAYADVVTSITSSGTYSMTNALNPSPGWNMLVYYIDIKPAGPPHVDWKGDDDYGIELHAAQMLPKGFHFELGATLGSETPDFNRITFNTDGSVACDWAADAGTTWNLYVVEDIGPTAGNRIRIGIAPNGTISRGVLQASP